MPAIKSSTANDGADSDDNMSIDNGGDSSSRAADSSAEDESDDSDMDEAEVRKLFSHNENFPHTFHPFSG